ncbi:MAG TPA: ATP-binding protein [Burkholderiales bacterium]|nr:ATP-binding protein [Burkholderiales bacterium]
MAGLPLRATAATSGAILVLYSNKPDLPAVKLFDSTFKSTISDANPKGVEIYSEYLDQDRFASEKHVKAYVALMRERYSSIRIAAAVAVGMNAYEFFQRNGDSLFGQPIPVVRALFVPAGKSHAALPDGVIDASAQIHPLATIQFALRLQPDTKRGVLVTGAGPWDLAWEHQLREDVGALDERLGIEYLSGLPMPALLDRLEKLPGDAIVFSPGFFADGAGKVFTVGDSMRAMTSRCSVPVYYPLPYIVGNGSVGGVITPLESVGWRTASIVNLLVEGKSVQEASRFPPLPATPTVDWRAMKRWQLDERRLPPNTTILFGQPTIWDRYWREMAAGVGVLLLQAGLIAALLVQRRARRVAAAALEESEHRVGLATHAAKLLTWTWDFSREPPELTYHVRRRNEMLTAQSQGIAEATLYPDDKAMLERAAREALSGEAGLDIECRVIQPGSETRWLSLRGMREQAGGPRLLGVALDITERKNADIQAAQDRAALRHLTRVSLLGQLSASITHELNQPLAAILNNAEAARKLLARDKLDVTELQGICEDIVAEDQRAANVISRLRALFKRGGVEAGHALQLNDLVRETLSLIGAELQIRHVSVATELMPDLPSIRGDRVELQQVLLNLIVNAADAMDAIPPGERKLMIRTEGSADDERLYVADCGTGIAEGNLKNVFEPFWSTKPRGMGMGLAICSSIAAAHQGALTVSNNSDRGATFCLRLPKRQEDGVQA